LLCLRLAELFGCRIGVGCGLGGCLGCCCGICRRTERRATQGVLLCPVGCFMGCPGETACRPECGIAQRFVVRLMSGLVGCIGQFAEAAEQSVRVACILSRVVLCIIVCASRTQVAFEIDVIAQFVPPSWPAPLSQALYIMKKERQGEGSGVRRQKA